MIAQNMARMDLEALEELIEGFGEICSLSTRIRIFQCKICHKHDFTSEAQFTKHFHEVHKIDKKFKCKILPAGSDDNREAECDIDRFEKIYGRPIPGRVHLKDLQQTGRHSTEEEWEDVSSSDSEANETEYYDDESEAEAKKKAILKQLEKDETDDDEDPEYDDPDDSDFDYDYEKNRRSRVRVPKTSSQRNAARVRGPRPILQKSKVVRAPPRPMLQTSTVAREPPRPVPQISTVAREPPMPVLQTSTVAKVPPRGRGRPPQKKSTAAQSSSKSPNSEELVRAKIAQLKSQQADKTRVNGIRFLPRNSNGVTTYDIERPTNHVNTVVNGAGGAAEETVQSLIVEQNRKAVEDQQNQKSSFDPKKPPSSPKKDSGLAQSQAISKKARTLRFQKRKYLKSNNKANHAVRLTVTNMSKLHGGTRVGVLQNQNKVLTLRSPTTRVTRQPVPFSKFEVTPIKSGFNQLKCTKCPKRFSYPSLCATHMIHSHLLEKEKNLKKIYCAFCMEEFKTGEGLRNHLKYAFSAETCDKRFETEFPVKCGLCEKGFLNLPCFEYHLKIHHATRPAFCAHLYSCAMCPTKQLLLKSIFSHVHLTHGIPKNKSKIDENLMVIGGVKPVILLSD